MLCDVMAKYTGLIAKKIGFIYLCIYLCNWIYWGDTGSQNSTGFKCTTQQKPSAPCVVHPWPKAKSLPITIHPPFAHFHSPPRPFPSGCHHTVVCVYVSYIYFWLNPFTFLHPIPLPPLWQLSVCSMCSCLFLFCQFILFIRFHI